MGICILPWTTDTAILPSFLDDVFSQLEQFDDDFYQFEQFDEQMERAASSFPRDAETSSKAKATEKGKMEKVIDQESKLSFLLDVSEFKPDELKVSIDGWTLTVEGKQEITEDSNYTSRQVISSSKDSSRNVDVDQIRSTLTENGQLAIEMPKPKSAVTAKTIPIRKTVNRQ
ncbi:Hsp20/alpha crystallin family protein [Teladorsagia circumcincta]|uniref:Hsp20/alpha crystallin family protein n=1 Tax=Teladorsagia circumcincta TaxID=45464 RepID=A0A2G9UJZ9_TELCI|nr:Hsp20/alpha crystallin family protein [Teladorsagia circumcincta]